MNIDTFGRIGSSAGTPAGHRNIEIQDGNKLKNVVSGRCHRFQELFGPEKSVKEVFDSSVYPLVQLFADGYNVCLMVFGEASAGKSFLVYGSGKPGSRGIMHLTFAQLFRELDAVSTRTDQHSAPVVKLRMFEVTDKSIRDLLSPELSKQIQIKYEAENGYVMQEVSSVTVSSSQFAVMTFDKAWLNRSHQAVTFVQLDLELFKEADVSSNVSRLTLVIVPILESQVAAPGVRVSDPLNGGDSCRRSVVSLTRLITDLSRKSNPDRVIQYNDSNLTRLIQEELGGNCKTDVMFCFKENSDVHIMNDILTLADSLRKITNFPIMNGDFARNLATQYRARIILMQQQMAADGANGLSAGEQQLLHKVQTENVKLRDLNERLQDKLERFQTSYGSMAISQTDLSDQLLSADQERLQMSKNLLDAQIENNRLREEYEENIFTLTNEISMLNQMLSDVTAERDEQIEENTKLQADAIRLMQLSKTHREPERQVRHNSGADPRNVFESAERQFMDNINRQPNQKEKSQEDEVKQLKSKINELQREVSEQRNKVNEQRNKVRECQNKISVLTPQLITLRSEKSKLEGDYNRDQHRLKSLVENLSQRLHRYIADIAKHVDDSSGTANAKNPGNEKASLRIYTNEMLKDLKDAHKVREEQLSLAAQRYKERLSEVVRMHEELTIAYSDLREQVRDFEGREIEIGPDESNFRLSDDELKSRQQREIAKLRKELSEMQTEMEAMKLRTRMNERHGEPNKAANLSEGSKNDEEKWHLLQKQVNNFTSGTQKELEQERAKLLSQNAMMQQEVVVLKDYIDSHLKRYREEILKQKKSGPGPSDTGNKNQLRSTLPHTDEYGRKPVEKSVYL